MSCAKDALEKIKEQISAGRSPYKLILIDYQMPQVNGSELAIMIRSHLTDLAPDQQQPYIVCMTGHMNAAVRFDSMDSSFDLLVSKPIFKEGMRRILTKAGFCSNS